MVLGLLALPFFTFTARHITVTNVSGIRVPLKAFYRHCDPAVFTVENGATIEIPLPNAPNPLFGGTCTLSGFQVAENPGDGADPSVDKFYILPIGRVVKERTYKLYTETKRRLALLLGK